MSFVGKTARACLLGTTLLLASCIDTREEFWLEADGSGRAEIHCSLPAAAARMHGGESGIRSMIGGFFKGTPQFTSSACEVAEAGNRLQIKINATFDSALDLKDVAAGPRIESLPSAASHLAGKITADVRGRSLDFSRTISPGKAIPGAAFFPASQFEGRSLVYIMHMPAAATESNATRLEDGGRTLIWEIPLADAVKSPVALHFKMDLPVPWKWVTGIAVPVSLLCGLMFLRMRKSQKTGGHESRAD